jgi:hypothetical protein
MRRKYVNSWVHFKTMDQFISSEAMAALLSILNDEAGDVVVSM